MDGNVAFRSPRSKQLSGADVVAKELDEFNARYQYLIDNLYGRLKEIAARSPGDIVTLVSRNEKINLINPLLFFFFSKKERKHLTVQLIKKTKNKTKTNSRSV